MPELMNLEMMERYRSDGSCEKMILEKLNAHDSNEQTIRELRFEVNRLLDGNRLDAANLQRLGEEINEKQKLLYGLGTSYDTQERELTVTKAQLHKLQNLVENRTLIAEQTIQELRQLLAAANGRDDRMAGGFAILFNAVCSERDELRSQLARLEGELAQAREDTERVNWLEADRDRLWKAPGGCKVRTYIDEAIDAARPAPETGTTSNAPAGAGQPTPPVCGKCKGLGYIDGHHKPGYTHYETDAGEPCPAYHFESVPCPDCKGQPTQLGRELQQDASELGKCFASGSPTYQKLQRERKLSDQLAEALKKQAMRLCQLCSDYNGPGAYRRIYENVPYKGTDGRFFHKRHDAIEGRVDGGDWLCSAQELQAALTQHAARRSAASASPSSSLPAQD